MWVHYIAVKVARGELFEAIDGLTFVRLRVLGPLLLSEAGAQPNGVRRIASASRDVARLRRAVPTHDAESCRAALATTVALYTDLREAGRSSSARSRGHPRRGVAAIGRLERKLLERLEETTAIGPRARLTEKPESMATSLTHSSLRFAQPRRSRTLKTSSSARQRVLCDFEWARAFSVASLDSSLRDPSSSPGPYAR